MLNIDSIVNSVFNSMTWLLSDNESNKVWLVDCGDIEPLLLKLGDREIAGVLLTHAHYDHIYGLPKAMKLFPNCMVYTNEAGKEALGNSKYNMSFYQEHPMTVEGANIRICREGDCISLFHDVTAEIFETPGHHPSCITYLVDGYCFPGDAYIPGIKVVTNLPQGDKKEAIKSQSRIIELSEGKTILSGHKI